MSTQRQATAADREAVLEAVNPLGLDGIEFIEYTTSRPQALGQALEMMGFTGPEVQEGIASLREKRKPNFPPEPKDF